MIGACCWTLAVVGVAGAAELSVTPDSVVLRQTRTVSFELAGVQGTGPLHVAVNIGEVLDVKDVSDHVSITYRLPRRRFPQELCLLVWREGGRSPVVLRVPLLGRATIPVRTRRRSKVELLIGDRVVASRTSGRRGRLVFRAVVPPGPRHATVIVTDVAGLRSEKRVAIKRGAYNRLGLVLQPIAGSSAEPPGLVATVAVAEDDGTTRPELRAMPADAADGSPIELDATRGNDGAWSIAWKPPPATSPTLWRIEASLPGSGGSRAGAEATVPGWERPALPEPKVASSAEQQPAKEPKRALTRRVRGTFALAGGLAHNFGDFFAPRVAAEAGVEIGLPRGQLGIAAVLALSWSSQTIRSGNGAALGSATSSVLLVPLGLAARYRWQLSRRLAVYGGAALIVQIARTRNEAEFAPTAVRYDTAWGGLGFGGAEWVLGPGRLFIQPGYQYSRLDNRDVSVLAGGFLLDAGYRLVF